MDIIRIKKRFVNIFWLKVVITVLIGLSIPSGLLAQGCLPEGISFATQQEIDAFPTNYPGCNEILGDLEIAGNDITDLSGLNSLTTIAGFLRIAYSDSLTQLIGLDNITTIGGFLAIGFNERLNSLNGLQNLTTLGEYLTLLENPALTDLSGLASLSSLNGNLTIWYNDSLSSISSLQNLDNITGALSLRDSPKLTTLNGLHNITAVGWQLELSGMTGLNSLSELQNLQYVAGQLIFVENGLIDFSGLENLTSIPGPLWIRNNDSLISFAGFENITSIGGDMEIMNNDMITDFNGFSKLNHIDGALQLRYNDKLESLMGLDSLRSMGSYLEIFQNGNLETLSGIDSLNPNSINHIHISHNPSLSYCHILFLCDHLSNPVGTIRIHDNDVGCNTSQQVLDRCWLGMNKPYLKSAITAYPNPLKQFLYISNPNGYRIDEIHIYNQIGERVLDHNNMEDYLDVSFLLPGLYILELRSGASILRKKLIKQ